jgi:cytochrome c oxidase cbb3-type subunit 1
MSGTVFYLLTCFQGPMHSLRSVNAIVSKTDWIPGHAHMAVLGAFSFFAIAGCLFAVPVLAGRQLHSAKLANQAFWLIFTGGIVFFAGLWIGGFMQGLQWNDPTIPFIDTVKFMRPFWVVRLLSGALVYVGIFLIFYNLIRTLTGASTEVTGRAAAAV